MPTSPHANWSRLVFPTQMPPAGELHQCSGQPATTSAQHSCTPERRTAAEAAGQDRCMCQEHTPASRRACTAGAETWAVYVNAGQAAVVGESFRSMLSFKAKGMPCSGVRLPAGKASTCLQPVLAHHHPQAQHLPLTAGCSNSAALGSMCAICSDKQIQRNRQRYDCPPAAL